MAASDPGTPARTVVFDTDVLIWYFRGDVAARRLLEQVGYARRAVSSLALMELIQGCRRPEEIRDVRAFVAGNFSMVLHPDEGISRAAIVLLEEHALASGLRVVDALIAATTLEIGASLATANVKHFGVVSRLALVPLKPGR